MAGAPQCPSLAQQIPALIEFGIDGVEPALLVGGLDVAPKQAFSQPVLLVHQTVDACQGVSVAVAGRAPGTRAGIGAVNGCHSGVVPTWRAPATAVGWGHETAAGPLR